MYFYIVLISLRMSVIQATGTTQSDLGAEIWDRNSKALKEWLSKWAVNCQWPGMTYLRMGSEHRNAK